MALQLLPKRRALPSPSLVQLFSSSAGDENNQSKFKLDSLFKDVKSSLSQPEKQSQPQPSLTHQLGRSAVSDHPPPRANRNIDEIKNSLSSFRNRSTSPTATKSNPYNEIRMKLPTLRSGGDRSLVSPGFKAAPVPGTKSPISASGLTLGVFEKDGSTGREYGVEELGEKLRKLKPERRGKDGEWFSFEELSSRLRRIREMDEKVSESVSESEATWPALKSLLGVMNTKAESPGDDGTGIGSLLIDTPDYIKLSPKEHLLATYHHPDNMSAAEKMKIELAKVRDEFRMSESDCGSTRVQVAQLTTKIKYLSSVIHKKDKHSRRGLVQMVHKRKKLLKYLRRTDWDSYCFVLDKLGLRDVTNYKK